MEKFSKDSMRIVCVVQCYGIVVAVVVTVVVIVVVHLHLLRLIVFLLSSKKRDTLATIG